MNAVAANDALLVVRDLHVAYSQASGVWRRARALPALRGVSFELRRGETLGVVGESGGGKSTLVRAILQLIDITAGTIEWQGRALERGAARERAALSGEMQLVFQDPRASLDPRMTMRQIVEEPLLAARPALAAVERSRRVATLLERVGLGAALADRYPHELSGGQCQRVGIARALVAEPRLLVCDEPVSALDVSVQAQIVNLLARLQRELDLALLFVSHNLAVVRHVSARILVLYLGRTLELAPREALFASPLHPYTRALLASIPSTRPGAPLPRGVLPGELPSPLDPPSGCVFRTRCPWAISRCAEAVPPLERVEGERYVACHRWREIASGTPP